MPRLLTLSIVRFHLAAVPLIVAGGGGGIGIAHSIDEEIQHGGGHEIGQTDMSGHRQVDVNGTGGAGGGWRAEVEALESIDGAALLQGGRGGEACYSKGAANHSIPAERHEFDECFCVLFDQCVTGVFGHGGFGGGGGGCITGGMYSECHKIFVVVQTDF